MAAGGASSLGSGEGGLNELAQGVAEGNVHLLDAGRGARRGAEAQVAQDFHLPPVAPVRPMVAMPMPRAVFARI